MATMMTAYQNLYENSFCSWNHEYGFRRFVLHTDPVKAGVIGMP
ncbi:hypothetical protein [Butyrivibrio sp.]|nr:hypothetical protein [Butyrivibrio sp.]